ncbi:hypothetical protein MTP04_08180 [Lysinibacillus sp. PLM2]|nr:hypothetical protein MTP04_08180 [Lysinibacillus sp. PLM2]
MSITLKSIELSQIRTETSFRDEKKEEIFVKDIKVHGINEPLTVEQESEAVYILVDGYRRFNALTALGYKTIHCIVQPLTSEEQRLIKRLDKALRPEKKRTPNELREMINQLLYNETYTVKWIVKYCDVSEDTIRKYIKINKIDPELLNMVDGTKSKEFSAAEKIDSCNLKMDIKKELMKRYKNGELTLAILDIIRKATKGKLFSKIPSTLVRNCLNDIIDTYYAQKLFYLNIIKKYIPGKLMKLNRASINNLVKMHSKSQKADSKFPSIMEDLTPKQKEGLVKYHWYSILNIHPSLISLTPSVYRNFEEINTKH